VCFSTSDLAPFQGAYVFSVIGADHRRIFCRVRFFPLASGKKVR
jgi:hypothetical protein